MVKLMQNLRQDFRAAEEPFERDYEVHREDLLGRGTYAEVFRGTQLRTRGPVAIKIFTVEYAIDAALKSSPRTPVFYRINALRQS